MFPNRHEREEERKKGKDNDNNENWRRTDGHTIAFHQKGIKGSNLFDEHNKGRLSHSYALHFFRVKHVVIALSASTTTKDQK